MNRHTSIDCAKFFCLFLMVFCHIPFPADEFHQVVYSFHMPLFFFVGGLFYDESRYSLKKGCRTLLFPYLIFNCLIILLNTIVSVASHSFSVQSLLNQLGGTMAGSSVSNPLGSLPAGPSWFLLAFFLVKLIAKYVLSLSRAWQLFLIFIPVVFVVLFRSHWTWSMWSIDSAIIGSLFFYTAYYGKSFVMECIEKRTSVLLFAPLLFITCFAWINGQSDMYACTWGNNFFLFLFFAFVGVMMILMFSKLLCSYIKIPTKFLKTILDGSIFIICMNLWLIDYLMLAYRCIVMHYDPLCWYEKLLITVVIFIISYICTPIILRWCPWVLGKKSCSLS